MHEIQRAQTAPEPAISHLHPSDASHLLRYSDEMDITLSQKKRRKRRPTPDHLIRQIIPGSPTRKRRGQNNNNNAGDQYRFPWGQVCFVFIYDLFFSGMVFLPALLRLHRHEPFDGGAGWGGRFIIFYNT
eukprot:UN14607